MIKKNIAHAWLRLGGWAFEGSPALPARCVLIAAPHTSNRDFAHMIAMAWLLGLRVRWMGKASLFRFPFGGVAKSLGGIPIRRDLRDNVVEQSAARFAVESELVLVVAAEGTRGKGTLWRSGFYHIARLAEVPIVLSYLDYARKRAGFGPALQPSGDVRADMDRIRAFYADKVGHHPERFTEPRLREESQTGAGDGSGSA